MHKNLVCPNYNEIEDKIKLKNEITTYIKNLLIEYSRTRSKKRFDTKALDELSSLILECLDESNKFITKNQKLNIKALMNKSLLSRIGGFIY